MPEPENDPGLKLTAAAAYSGLSVDTLRDRIRSGDLTAERAGPYQNSPIVVRLSALDAMLRPVGAALDLTHIAPDALVVTLARITSSIRELQAVASKLEASARGDVR